MFNSLKIKLVLNRILREDGRYRIEAYGFVLAALSYTLNLLEEKRHITGREFLSGISRYAKELFGPLAADVLRNWGIKETVDFGNIVFTLVENGLMGRTEQDSVEDFTDVFDFDEELAENYLYLD